VGRDPGSIRTDQSSETYPIGSFQFFHHHTILKMSTPSTSPLAGRVVYKRSALDRVGITRWDSRNYQEARANFQKPYPSANEVSIG